MRNRTAEPFPTPPFHHLVGVSSVLSRLSPQVGALKRRLLGSEPDGEGGWQQLRAKRSSAASVTNTGERRTGARTADAVRKQVVSGYRQGATINDLAIRLGLHRTTVMRILKDARIPTRKYALDESMIERVSQLRRDGHSLREIGERLGVQRHAVRRFLVRHGIETVGDRASSSRAQAKVELSTRSLIDMSKVCGTSPINAIESCRFVAIRIARRTCDDTFWFGSSNRSKACSRSCSTVLPAMCYLASLGVGLSVRDLAGKGRDLTLPSRRGAMTESYEGSPTSSDAQDEDDGLPLRARPDVGDTPAGQLGSEVMGAGGAATRVAVEMGAFRGRREGGRR